MVSHIESRAARYPLRCPKQLPFRTGDGLGQGPGCQFGPRFQVREMLADDWSQRRLRTRPESLAALLVQQPDATGADYKLALELASKAAQQNDVAGQLLLASFYHDGRVVPKDLQKAQFWTQRAQQSRMAAQWKLWNKDVFMGLTPMDLVKGYSRCKMRFRKISTSTPLPWR